MCFVDLSLANLNESDSGAQGIKFRSDAAFQKTNRKVVSPEVNIILGLPSGEYMCVWYLVLLSAREEVGKQHAAVGLRVRFK